MVLGPNGAGKSTLLKCLVGAVRSAPGRVRVLGEDVGSSHAVALTRLRRRVAYLAQMLAPGSEMPLTLREVVAIGRTGRAGPAASAAAARLATRGRLDRPPRTAAHGSAGVRRVVRRRTAKGACWRWRWCRSRKSCCSMNRPRISMRTGASRLSRRSHHCIANTSLTIVLVCHDLEAIPVTTDHAVCSAAGRWWRRAGAGEVLTQDRIEALYGGGLSVLCHGGRYVLVPTPAEDGP